MSQMARSERFEGGLVPEAAAFCAAIGFDWRLLPQDIRGSIAHCAMLEKTGLISGSTAEKIRHGLEQVLAEWQAGTLVPRPEWEDVHMNVEGRLHEIIGADAGFLHMARSRNDQVATDMHCYMMDASTHLSEGVLAVVRALDALSVKTEDVIMAGYTHLQPAQPIRMAHHWLAYAWMFQRDLDRLADWQQRTNRSPLGAGALAGTPYPTDPEFTRIQLGLGRLYENSLDAVADRDYLVEFLAWASLFMVHVSRLAEELALWSSPSFGFIALGDGYSTGSSIMPQKKNPDVAELLRGKSGRVFGHLQALLTVLKGLPLAYNSDMQEDKEAVFDVVDTVQAVLALLPGLLESLAVYPDRLGHAANADFVNATDLADRITMAGVPFRAAHHRVGQLVRTAIEAGYRRFADVPEALWNEWAPDIPHAWVAALTPEALVEARQQPFATALSSVRAQREQLRQWMHAWESAHGAKPR